MLAGVSQTAWIITVAYSVAVVVGSAIAFVVYASTRSRAALTEEAVETFSRREGVWLVIVLALLFALLMATIFYVPYGQTAGAGKQIVQVDGVQFAWAINPGEVKAGVPVEFRLRTRDVNHGFGVYDEDGVLQFQVQVIPDETQHAVHTFDRPGTYRILCLEYCGKLHHEMTATLEVRS